MNDAIINDINTKAKKSNDYFLSWMQMFVTLLNCINTFNKGLIISTTFDKQELKMSELFLWNLHLPKQKFEGASTWFPRTNI